MSWKLCRNVIAIATIASTVGCALYHEQVPFFPIEISKTANEYPSKWIFQAGGNIIVALNYQYGLHPKHRFPRNALLILASVGVVVLTGCTDHDYPVFHAFGAMLMFLSSILLSFLHYGVTIRGCLPACFFFVRTILGPLQWFAASPERTQFWQQIRAPFQWLTVLTLLVNL